MEGGGLFEQLGINWKIFVSQIINFCILLTILYYFVYKPLLRVIKERNRKIEIGLEKAKEAEVRLNEIDNIGKERLKNAENQALEILKEAKEKARHLEQQLQKEREKKQKEIYKEAEEQLKKQLEENKKIIFANCSELVKDIIRKTVEMKPETFDDSLIKKAAEKIYEGKS